MRFMEMFAVTWKPFTPPYFVTNLQIAVARLVNKKGELEMSMIRLKKLFLPL